LRTNTSLAGGCDAIPADEAFQPLSASRCPLNKK
jgi:hypothetical protein